MKLIQIVTGLLFAIFVSASTDFIPDGRRPKLFELMDDEVPDFRIQLPPNILEELKTEISTGGGGWFGKRDEIGKKKRQGSIFDRFDDFINSQKEHWKTKNATLSVTINGVKKDFDKVTFSIGGSNRFYARQRFNLKIRGKEDLFGRKQFRIRPDAREATYLRSKLVCDIQNRIGMTSISANYISLYVNDEYWGFYVLMDSPKPTWAELEYGDKNSTNIMKCNYGGSTLAYRDSATQCVNENDEATDNTDWINLLTQLDNAQSTSQIQDIFDVDQFIYNMIYEYLCGSWDHFLNTGHNFVVYKKPQQYGGKWTMIEYDFNSDFGQDILAIEYAGTIKADKNYPDWSFDDWTSKSRHVLDICIKKDNTRFRQLLQKVIEDVFNPRLLFPRIDELKDFIRPYVLRDKTPVDGKKPGMLDTRFTADYTMEEWEANSEFTNIGVSSSSSAYGLKFWILLRYRRVCTDFKFDCDPEYMDINYYYDIDRKVEGPINTRFFNDPIGFGGAPRTTQSQPPKPTGYTKTTRTITRKTTTTTVVKPTNDSFVTVKSKKRKHFKYLNGNNLEKKKN